MPFSADDLEDFQTQHKHCENVNNFSNKPEEVEYLDGNVVSLLPDKNKKWYEPQNFNQWQLYTRVIITMCPSDNDSAILIIFDEPRHEEYLVSNETNTAIKFAKFDHKAKANFHELITIPAKEYAPFVWNYREKLLKRVQI